MKTSSLPTVSTLGLAICAALSLPACQPTHTDTAQTATQQQARAQVKKIADGVVVSPAQGQAKAVRIQVYQDDIFRITSLAHDDFSKVAKSIQVVAEAGGDFEVTQNAENVVVSTAKGQARVSLNDGRVSIVDKNGTTLLAAKNSGQFGPVTADPEPVKENSQVAKHYALTQQWNEGVSENLFGLGQHQNGLVNLKQQNVFLTTHNLEITIPFLVSDKHYGILWDNASQSHFGNPEGLKPLNEDLDLYTAEGTKGGLTARYYDGDKLLLTREETGPDYQFLAHNTTRETPFPAQLGEVTEPRIVWSGSLEAKQTGKHTLKMYSSGYAKLSLNNEVVLDRWRMNWNPWYHDVTVDMTKGQKVPVEIEWDSQGGYLALNHIGPTDPANAASVSLSSETGRAIDYYVVLGDDYDDIIGGYRQLTGKAVLLPKWAYGFWQSRERYKNQQEVVDTVKQYRQRDIPLDNIVLDWSYWPQDAWGSHKFDQTHFPEPQKMIDQVHKLDANIMISVWPKFYASTDNYIELDAKGYMLNRNVKVEQNLDWIGPGYLNGFYDPYPQESQQIFWRQLDENLNSKGIDAWWLDASEPDIHSNLSYQKRKENMTGLSVGTGAQYFNSYAVPNAEGVYKGERESDPEKRAFILTRSGFGGIQRAAAAIWSGDTVTRWSNLKEQIAAGVGTGLSGMPNWTMDIGGFTPENHYRYADGTDVGHFSQMDKEYQQQWQEINLRWFQFGAFVPLFRSHGQNPYREIYNIADEGTPVYNSMVYYTRLRYRLLPYIYSEAGKMYDQHNTLMRGLVMDFADDEKALNINDAYMFGPALLVNPIYEAGATTREVYLPANTQWYDFYTGKAYQGGQTITAAAPLNRIPLFVRAGAILPTGPAIQTVYEKPDAPYLLTIYAGANGDYTLYQDDGKSYDYEQGKSSLVRIQYDDATRTVTLHKRVGAYDSMTPQREYRIRLIDGATESATNWDTEGATTLLYKGEKISTTL